MRKTLMTIMISVLFMFGVLSIGCAPEEPDNIVTIKLDTVIFKDFIPGSEPNGLAGIKWGTELKTLWGMVSIGEKTVYDGLVTTMYERTGEKFKLGGAMLDTIRYDFHEDKFVQAMVTTKGGKNWKRLKAAVFEMFGEGLLLPMPSEAYIWTGNITTMLLEYDMETQEGRFSLSSMIFVDKIKSLKNSKR